MTALSKLIACYFRDWKVAAPLKRLYPHQLQLGVGYFRDWKVAAPLKP